MKKFVSVVFLLFVVFSTLSVPSLYATNWDGFDNCIKGCGGGGTDSPCERNCIFQYLG